MKILAILIGLMIASVPAFAASELSDGEMGAVYAGVSVDLDINKVTARDSAAIAQSNVGAVVSEDDQLYSSVTGYNLANVTNSYGNSAAALQSNISGAVSLGYRGDISVATVTNTNNATVANNLYDDRDMREGVDAKSIKLDLEGVDALGADFVLNSVKASNSAVASQSNIGVVAAIGHNSDISSATVANYNYATVTNVPNAMFLP